MNHVNCNLNHGRKKLQTSEVVNTLFYNLSIKLILLFLNGTYGTLFYI